MEKMIIIGAGIAGLTAGVYARLNGFETEIHEMHSIPGGECTAWKRGEYIFDNCIHWLMGSKPGSSLHRLWRDVGGLDDSVPIIIGDEFSRLEMDGRTAVLYRNLDRLEKHLLELSPQDEKAIREMCRAARAFKKMDMPIDAPRDMITPWAGMKLAAKMLPMMGLLSKYNKMTIAQYASGFKDPLLRAMVSGMMPEPYSAMPFLMLLASLDSGDSGFPAGGSLPFARRMENRYLSLGGKVFYSSRVESILVEDGRAAGVRLSGGKESRADWVISCADGQATLSQMLGGNYTDSNMQSMYADPEAYPVYSTVQVSLGINADLSQRPHMLIVAAETPVDAGGVSHFMVGLKNYCFDKSMVPPGKSVVTVLLSADFDWWKAKKEDAATYRAEKERVGREVSAAIEARYPETKGRIERVDVVTPMTYVRYCGAWRGAWMSFMTTPKSKISYLPGNLPGLERFYLAGQWTLPPGGLPGAAMAARWVVQRICANNGSQFKTS